MEKPNIRIEGFEDNLYIQKGDVSVELDLNGIILKAGAIVLPFLLLSLFASPITLLIIPAIFSVLAIYRYIESNVLSDPKRRLLARGLFIANTIFTFITGFFSNTLIVILLL